MATLAPPSRLRGRTVVLRTLVDALDRAAGAGRPSWSSRAGPGSASPVCLPRRWRPPAPAGSRWWPAAARTWSATARSGCWPTGFGCTRSSPDPRRAAIAALLGTSAGDRGITTVSSDPGLQFQAVDAFLDLAEAMAGRGPLALGLDDLQWADPSSLLTLGALARRLPDGPLALLVSCGRCPAAGTWSGPWRPWRPPGRAA